jgi:hypothetical protein
MNNNSRARSGHRQRLEAARQVHRVQFSTNALDIQKKPKERLLPAPLRLWWRLTAFRSRISRLSARCRRRISRTDSREAAGRKRHLQFKGALDWAV